MEIDDVAGPDRNVGVITPKVIGIGPRRYRTRFQAAGHDGNATATELAWADDSTLAEGIEQRSDGRFGATVTVPSAFMGKLIGKKGEGKRRIEKETKTVVTVPRRGAGEGVDIVGGTTDGVASARTRIEMLVASAVKSAGISHFVSIQLAGPDFATMLLTFKERALDLGARGLSEELFVDHAKLHLTIGVLRLYGDAQIKAATALLRRCADDVRQLLASKRSSKTIVVKGIESMNDDPMQVDVVYAKVSLKGEGGDGQGDVATLQQLADLIKTQFVAARLMEAETDRGPGVKLHATVINSKKRGGGGGGGGGRRESFDGTAVLKKLGRFEFGESVLRELQLSRMVPRSKSHKGYYEAESTAKI